MTIRVIALIPARGGSKGVRKKNMHQLFGAPLIDHTIRASLLSVGVNETYVSSDDTEIIEHSRNKGVEVIVRPPEYATDESSPVDVVRHFVSTLGSLKKLDNTLIVYLQPTSPLRTEKHIDDALNLLKKQNKTELLSVTEMHKSPYKSFVINEHGFLESLFDESLSNTRRQDLPVAYIPNGAIYIFSIAKFMSHSGFPSNGSVPYIMSERDSVDVDTLDDIKIAEKILKERLCKQW